MVASRLARILRRAAARGLRALALGALALCAFPADGAAAPSENGAWAERPALPVARPRRSPDILSADDIARYRRVFALQEDGRWREAARVVAALENNVLMGHVQAQKYLHPTKYRSKYKELLLWMRSYADHPQAPRIYRLAVKRRPKGWKPPPPPNGRMLRVGGREASAEPPDYVSPRKRSAAVRREVRALRKQMRARIRRGWPTGAYRVLRSKAARRVLDPVETALARAEIARGYFAFGKDGLALELAGKSIAEDSRAIPVAAWTGGLAAWRQGDFARSERMFAALATWIEAPPPARAAGAYWAHRASLRMRRPREANRWLAQAATVPGSFHGLLARRALGVETPLDWSLPPVSGDRLDELLAIPGARRGLALAAVGRHGDAEREFRMVFAAAPERLQPVVMAIAARNGMPGLAMRAADILRARGHRPYYAALFPLPPWRAGLAAGVDPALLYAVIRRESQFDARARSRRGASGLMQLMPRTAASVDPGGTLRRAAGRRPLFDPEVNVALGARYVRRLLDLETVGGDLFKMLAAYNAGPGTLRKWEREVDYKDDPLFFIEAIPSPETRGFVEGVLRNLWMYRMRRGEPAPSLNRVAAGGWPRYESVDGVSAEGWSHAGNR